MLQQMSCGAKTGGRAHVSFFATPNLDLPLQVRVLPAPGQSLLLTGWGSIQRDSGSLEHTGRPQAGLQHKEVRQALHILSAAVAIPGSCSVWPALANPLALDCPMSSFLSFFPF